MAKSERRSMAWSTFKRGCIHYVPGHAYREPMCAFPLDMRLSYVKGEVTGPVRCSPERCPRWRRLPVVEEKA